VYGVTPNVEPEVKISQPMKNAVPLSPPKITPNVVTALQTLLCGLENGQELAELLLLEQDVRFAGNNAQCG